MPVMDAATGASSPYMLFGRQRREAPETGARNEQESIRSRASSFPARAATLATAAAPPPSFTLSEPGRRSATSSRLRSRLARNLVERLILGLEDARSRREDRHASRPLTPGVSRWCAPRGQTQSVRRPAWRCVFVVGDRVDLDHLHRRHQACRGQELHGQVRLSDRSARPARGVPTPGRLRAGRPRRCRMRCGCRRGRFRSSIARARYGAPRRADRSRSW